jgi:hypothetical protein
MSKRERAEITEAYLRYFGVSSVEELNELLDESRKDRYRAYRHWIVVRV